MFSASRLGSGASRPPSSSSILAPLSAEALNQSQSQSQSQPQAQIARHALSQSSSGAMKRRRPDTEDSSLQAPAADHLLKAPIVLKLHPSTLTVKPRILQPLMLLPREHLHLSALDLAQPHGDFPASRLFESKIKILDLEGRLGSNVLLARSETSRIIYAIEREGSGLYVLCKLGAWVDIENLGLNATVVCSQAMRNRRSIKVDESAVAPMITPHMYKESKRRRLAIEEIQSMVRKRSVVALTDKDPSSQTSTPKEQTPTPEVMDTQDNGLVEAPIKAPADVPLPLPDGQGSLAPALQPDLDILAQPSAEDIFQNVRMQYFEALYHSMGSLAYFAKGPLSQARAAFHLDCDANLEMNDLIDFLKSLVMTTVVIDKKYRETIPGTVEKLKTLVDESGDGETKPKKRKRKKPKLGKDALYPSEHEHVRRWWAVHGPVSNGESEKSTRDMETKYHISCLRKRETQMQMILILEILALEPLSRPVEDTEEIQLPGAESQTIPREPVQEAATKKRNKNNLPVLLDVHADRLCIWQTTTTDEVKALAESQALGGGSEPQRPDRVNSDSLRDFCVDIIVPFFSARLPELCGSINRKLGGPVVQSPPKEKQAKHLSALKARPGAPTKRPAPTLRKDKERTLERVLSKERIRRSASRGPSGAIALMRTASATTIPGLKREGSEPLLSMIPRGAIGSLKDKTSNIFKRSTAPSSLGGQKAKPKVDVEAELKDAISALKRPNRALVNKELTEEAEKRVSVSNSHPKKVKKPGRASAVLIKATPANNRFRDVIAAESRLPQLAQPSNAVFDSVPSSSSFIPASIVPRKFANMLSASSATTRPLSDSIQATPSRQAFIPKTTVRPPSAADDILDSSPIMARKAAPSSNSQYLSVSTIRLGKGQGATDMLPSSPGLAALFETPVNPKSARDRLAMGLNDTPIKSRLPVGDTSLTSNVSPNNDLGFKGGGGTKVVDIYQQLGWDD